MFKDKDPFDQAILGGIAVFGGGLVLLAAWHALVVPDPQTADAPTEMSAPEEPAETAEAPAAEEAPAEMAEATETETPDETAEAPAGEEASEETAEAPAEEEASEETAEAPAEEEASEETAEAPAEEEAPEETAEAPAEEEAPAEMAEATETETPDETAETPAEEEASEETAEAPAEDEAPEETAEAPAEEEAPEETASAEGDAAWPEAQMAYLDGDADAGSRVWNQCRACHVAEQEQNRVGPHLVGIVGRNIASIDGFRYSSALQELQGNQWTPEELDAWLLNPREYATGTSMSYPGVKDDGDRANLLAYLYSLQN